MIATNGHELGFIACGTIRTGDETDFSRRLLTIFHDLGEVIRTHRPTVAAVEDIFIDRNPRSALKLGHARGAAVVAALHNNLEVFDYPARQVKQTVAGYGQAEKAQVQHMVRSLLQLSSTPHQGRCRCAGGGHLSCPSKPVQSLGAWFMNPLFARCP